jgi:hypothetical protein
MDMHLAPFARARAAQEEKQREETRAEEEARAARLREKQAAAREQLQQNQAYTRSWNSGGMQEWRSNMERIEATKMARKAWNSKVAQQEAAKTSLGQRERRHEVASGIDEFERNLERIGAGANNNNSSAAAASGSSDDAAAYQQAAGQEISAVQQMSVKLAASLGSPAQLAKQVRFTILHRSLHRMLVLLMLFFSAEAIVPFRVLLFPFVHRARSTWLAFMSVCRTMLWLVRSAIVVVAKCSWSSPRRTMPWRRSSATTSSSPSSPENPERRESSERKHGAHSSCTR